MNASITIWISVIGATLIIGMVILMGMLILLGGAKYELSRIADALEPLIYDEDETYASEEAQGVDKSDSINEAH